MLRFELKTVKIFDDTMFIGKTQYKNMEDVVMRKIVGIFVMTIVLSLHIVSPVIRVRASEGDNIKRIEDEIKMVNIVFGGGDIVVESWNESCIGFCVEKGKNSNGYEYTYSVKDKGLYIEASQKNGYSSKIGDNKVYLFMPEEKAVNLFEIVNGNGNAQIEKVNCMEMDIYSATGTVEISDLVANDVNIVVGLGKVDMKGTIKSNFDVLCNAGEVNAELNGLMREHNYVIETIVGRAKIGRNNYGMLSNNMIDNRAKSNFDLECVAGEIILEFRGEK